MSGDKQMAPRIPAGPYSIGSDHWPGLSKLNEEAGEVVQVIGKIMGTGGRVEHWDGPVDLKTRLEHEIADVMAACHFVMEKNNLDMAEIGRRAMIKKARFEQWHEEQSRKDDQ